jgi:tyrosinase
VISQAQAVANDFPPGPIRDKYLTAAATLRIPYWDWAMDPPAGENSIPSCMTDITIQVIAPNGTETIANPLYSYTFHPIDPGLAYMPVCINNNHCHPIDLQNQYIQWSQTLRWPTDIGADAQTQVDVLISQVNSNQNQMKQRLYNLFTGMSNFSEFGNEAWIPNGGAGTYDSLESIHDQIHGTVGGSNYGDMTVIAVSAFDPSFWLHHA